MAIIPKFSVSDVVKYMGIKKENIEQAIINRLKFVGEKFVINARDSGTYTDRTGNLRSSIGYIIVKDGKVLENSFPGSIEKGKKTGLGIALDAADKFPTGIVLIVVAGMDYAAAVESYHKDVLTASSITAEDDLIKSFKELKTKLGG